MILTSRKDLMSSYFFVLYPWSQKLSILPDILRKGIMEPALPDIFYCSPAWSCPQLKQYSSSIYYHQSSLKLSNHPDMHLIACSTKAHGCMLSVLLNRFLSTLLISLWKENVLASSMMLLLSPILMRWSVHLASKQIVPQLIFGVGAFLTFIQCSRVITFIDNHVSNDDIMKLSFKYNIVP